MESLPWPAVFPESSSPLIISACDVNNWASWVTDYGSCLTTVTLVKDHGKPRTGRVGSVLQLRSNIRSPLSPS